MQKHTQIYFDAFGHDKSDPTTFVKSEISDDKAVDIHHIIGRGKGGEDRIENLMAVTRIEHQDYGDEIDYMVMLFKIHRRYLQVHNIEFDNNWFEFYILKWDALASLNDPDFFKKHPN